MGPVKNFRVDETGVGEMGVGEMGQIIDEMGVGEMGVIHEDMHKISDKFEFRPDRTTDYGISCPWASKKNSHRLIMGKWCLHASSVIFNRIIIKVACIQDRYKSSGEFEFGPN